MQVAISCPLILLSGRHALCSQLSQSKWGALHLIKCSIIAWLWSTTSFDQPVQARSYSKFKVLFLILQWKRSPVLMCNAVCPYTPSWKPYRRVPHLQYSCCSSSPSLVTQQHPQTGSTSRYITFARILASSNGRSLSLGSQCSYCSLECTISACASPGSTALLYMLSYTCKISFSVFITEENCRAQLNCCTLDSPRLSFLRSCEPSVTTWCPLHRELGKHVRLSSLEYQDSAGFFPSLWPLKQLQWRFYR